MTDASVTPVADPQVFRDVIGRFTSGVTVITTAVDGVRFGTTASAFSSLSMEPPMVLICLNKTSETQAAVLKAGAFVVNILSEGQQDLAFRFARKGDKFGIPFARARETYAPFGETCRVRSRSPAARTRCSSPTSRSRPGTTARR